MTKSGINAKNVRFTNRGLILQYLATAKLPVTRGELTHYTGLTKMTVSNIVGEFLDQKFLVETPRNPELPVSRSNPLLLQIAPSAPKVVGIRIRHSCCIATLTDLRLQAISTRRISLRSDMTGAELLGAIGELIEPYMNQHQICGIGIGSIGPVVDEKQDIVMLTLNYVNYYTLNIREYLETRYHVPVCAYHTSSCAVLAEQYYGAASAYQQVIYLSMATGFDLGVISNGQLQSSSTGLSGGIGHVCISFDGPKCKCGKSGCLEAFCNQEMICRKAGELPEIGEELTFAQLCERSEQPAVHELLVHGLLDYLVVALSNVTQLLHPEAIYLGDELARLPQRYIDYMEQALNRSNEAIQDYRYIKLFRATIPSEDTSAFCAVAVLKQMFNDISMLKS